MIQTVARRIYEKRNGAGCTPWSRLPRSHQEPYLGDARAAIEAMREPTEAMLDASGRGRLRARIDWEAFIDAALTTPPAATS
ncbi:hypothetical protein [Phenylobacterium sp. J367]|uniref:hypothetical protein n=1 Tax=Phenylobacterium sp. J367 TaxID=2898435 RepID=UPI00215194DE|nr:hypothetical protein [Phenylobacterium sp. J367]MCR5876982.1 hypothetical protein [Phenylobacterium sp. J367]MCR5881180.1 hypothetical protein [Phenylobacterium sp. J367]